MIPSQAYSPTPSPRPCLPVLRRKQRAEHFFLVWAFLLEKYQVAEILTRCRKESIVRNFRKLRTFREINNSQMLKYDTF